MSNEQQTDSYPLISVIVPIYNVEKYLDRCVESIVNQSYTNLEIILVDDGSTDSCPFMCDSWAQKDSRIRIIHKLNGGLSSARNAGIDAAHGEYLGFIDSDDYVLPEMYSLLFKLLAENNADLSICSYQRVDEEGTPLPDCNNELEAKVLVGDEILTEWMTRELRYSQPWNKLCRAELFRELRFPEGRLHEDEFMAHHLLGKCSKIVSTSAMMYMYTRRSNSILSTVARSFIAQGFDDMMYSYEDRYYFFLNIGRKDLADRVIYGCYTFIRSELRRGSYLKNFRIFNRAIGFTMGACLKSSGLRPKLMPIKMVMWILLNIAKDFYHFLRGKSA